MGLTHVTAKIRDLADASPTPFEAESLVDAGSIDCMVPREELLAAGVCCALLDPADFAL